MTELPRAEGGVIPEWTMGDRLRKAREHAGLQQQELADEVGISRNSISSYELDHTKPQRPTLLLWALRCGVPLEWIVTGRVTVSDPDGPLTGRLEVRVLSQELARRLAPRAGLDLAIPYQREEAAA
ncbi:MAG TPA: helix-turn-helix transcriptional regulator [Acidothermaceae bacterium]|nr:helix-turn-helix transcriptional regulator [Acidothermaceae bacterium]